VEARILTLFLTRDASTFVYKNYEKVKFQEGVEQEIYVVSAEPIPIENNIVVPVPRNYPLPIRIGVTINEALRRFNLSKYTHIFKVDGDVNLPHDYLANLLAKKAPLAGRGAAMLISVKFLQKVLKGKYPISYCDDGYVSAVSVACGYWPPEYDGEDLLWFCRIYQPSREYSYGREYYKWGLPLSVFILLLPQLFVTRRRDLKSLIYNLVGYLSALLNKEKRYPWWRSYAYYRVKHLVSKLDKLITGR